ncbi:hypothetical protein RDG66_16555 [Vibrio cholerae]|nr:hypothetical protein [Vibrio cholerae]EGR0786717.1 hypothetical protein [Vibrio cholerae]EGR0836777.1 hypothetical protein [Vibrio cholerae]EGR0845284.1 hypothetical protein [Vibrio cholerae]EGR0862549.1 hypothetical protein [Vibrio cholerae]
MIFEWFSTVFSEPTEQAKLFTVAISTTLAVALLLLNQWFIRKRDKKERTIEKLEELTGSVREFYSLGNEVNRSLNLNKNYDENLIEKFVGLGIRIDTLCNLYFRQSKIDTSISADIISLGMDALSEPKLESGDTIPSDHPYLETNEELHMWFETSQSKLEKLIHQHVK